VYKRQVITAVASYFIMKEEFTIRQILGITLTIGGLFLSQLQWRKIFGIKKKIRE
jgi:drug/metabolite transporter (DMT)-like permease